MVKTLLSSQDAFTNELPSYPSVCCWWTISQTFTELLWLLLVKVPQANKSIASKIKLFLLAFFCFFGFGIDFASLFLVEAELDHFVPVILIIGVSICEENSNLCSFVVNFSCELVLICNYFFIIAIHATIQISWTWFSYDCFDCVRFCLR